MKKHANIPLFIPHLGCPNRCVFCNQHTISGTVCFRKESVCTQIETVLATIPRDMPCEIAFFGGSFTGIDRDLMVYLLNLATSYVYAGRVRAIRFSTRPDYITPEIVRILARYPIGMAELGIQSMSDRVLAACDRGHTAVDTVTACGLLRDAGIPYGGQMMLGLPESTAEDERECAAAIAALGCTESRIYPTIVFRDTPLAALWEGACIVRCPSRKLWNALPMRKKYSTHMGYVPCESVCATAKTCMAAIASRDPCIRQWGNWSPAASTCTGSRTRWSVCRMAFRKK